MPEIIDIGQVLMIPAFAVVIWQLREVNKQLTAANLRYEELVERITPIVESLKKKSDTRQF